MNKNLKMLIRRGAGENVIVMGAADPDATLAVVYTAPGTSGVARGPANYEQTTRSPVLSEK